MQPVVLEETDSQFRRKLYDFVYFRLRKFNAGSEKIASWRPVKLVLYGRNCSCNYVENASDFE